MKQLELFENLQIKSNNTSKIPVLYHGTDLSKALNIIRYNIIEDRSHALPDLIKGVSCSRLFDVAYSFGPVIFELDKIKLRNNHKIFPYNYFNFAKHTKAIAARTISSTTVHNQNTEAEEFIVGEIKNMENFLIYVWVPSEFKITAVGSAIFRHPKLKFY